MRFTVIGSGAIGGLIGAHLVRTGHDVLFCDSDPQQVAALTRDGLRVQGPVETFGVAVRAVLPADLPPTLDVVLLAVKAQDTAQAVRGLGDRLAPDGMVLTLQNGLPSRALTDEVGLDRVVLGFVNIGADVIAPAVVHQGNVAAFRIGEPDGRLTPRVIALAAALPWAEPTGEILGYLWGKEAYGAMLIATALSDRSIADTFADPAHQPLLLALAREVLAQSPVPPQAFDGFTPDDLEGSLGRLAAFNRASAKTHTGVYRDLAVRRRRTEVPSLLDDLSGPLTRHLSLLVGSIERGERRCEPATLALLGAYEAADRLGRPLNAVVALLPAPARAADGPLLGIQVAVKDMVDVEGHPRGNGNPHDMAGPPRRSDAPLVTRLRAQAADVFALSTLLEYAAGAPHPDLGEARNPAAPHRTAGGSSGGSAALVGAGVCAVAVGTDTGGSIRVPASYCGVVGLKPSFGLLPVDGVEPLSPSCDHVGLIGRDVATVRLVLAAVTTRTAPTPAPVRLRLGVLRAQVDHPSVQPEVAVSVRAALATLTAAGHDLVDVDDGALAALHPLLEPIVLAEAWQLHGSRLRADPGHYGAPTAGLLAAAAGVSTAVHTRAAAERARLVPAALALTDGLDALVGPTLPFVAPESTPAFDGPDGDLETLFLGALNLTGQPAVTLPCGRTGVGLPVGLQLVGAVGSDDHLLAVAEVVESCLGAG